MSAFNITVEDTSPLITYNGPWTTHFDNETDPDKYIRNYTGCTFHETKEKGANATLNFFGSAIYVYGSFRPYHGSYVVHLDDIIWTSSAYSDTYQFGALVYAKSGLDNTYHTLTIVDQGTDPDKRWVDIDNIVYTTGDPALNSNYKWSSTDLSSNSLKWSGNWSSQTDLELNLDDTQRYSWSPGSSVRIPFQGTMVHLQGFTHPSAGQYSVSIDKSPAQYFNATSPSWNFNSTLYFASGLSQGQHNLVLTNTGPDTTFVSLGSISIAQIQPSTIALEVAGVTMLVFGLLAGIALLSIIIRRRRQERNELAAGLRPYLLLPEPSTSRVWLPGMSSKAPSNPTVPWPEPRPSTSQEQVNMIRSVLHPDLERGYSDVATYGSSRHHHDRDASSAPLLDGRGDVHRSPSEVSLELDPPDYTSPKPSMRAALLQRQKGSYRI